MAHLASSEFQALRIAVLTISDTRTQANDGSGQTLVDGLQEAGHILQERALVPDDIWRIRARLCTWIADPQVQVVLLTGGTGFTARDNTPQAVAPLLDKRVEGFGELFRQISHAEIGTSTLQSRALAGLSNGTLVCCLPGSPGACRTGWEAILREQLDCRTQPCNFVAHLKPGGEPAVSACASRS
ncbi:molybdenum cofactor biosynthesis protein B [Pseudomonas putida]